MRLIENFQKFTFDTIFALNRDLEIFGSIN